MNYNPVTLEYLDNEGNVVATDADIVNFDGPQRRMPAQKPGRSKQDYGTQPEFLAAIKARLGIVDFDIDLAASAENAVTARYYDEAKNSLMQPWDVGDGWSNGWNWLNPPFARIEPWVKKAWLELRPTLAAMGWRKGPQTAVLVPAAVGANWWRDWVHEKASVLLLNGRLTFVGETAPYPKDCALLLYTNEYTDEGAAAKYYDVWTWRNDVPKEAAKAA